MPLHGMNGNANAWRGLSKRSAEMKTTVHSTAVGALVLSTLLSLGGIAGGSEIAGRHCNDARSSHEIRHSVCSEKLVPL